MRARTINVLRASGSLCALLLVAAKCPQGSTKVVVPTDAASQMPDSADLIIAGYRAVLTDEGVTKGVLLADTAYSYEQGTRMEMAKVNVTFFTPHGAKDGTMTSRKGRYSTRLGRLEALGNVRVRTEDGRRLDTQQLVYDQQRNQIYSDSAYVLNKPPRIISGIGFETDPKLSVFKSLRNTKGVTPLKLPE